MNRNPSNNNNKSSSQKKIILITSSPHIQGPSTQLGRKCLDTCIQAGFEGEEIYLPQYNLNYCTGCMNCLRQQDCILHDGLNEIKEKILQADGIILSSPCYGLMPNAIMINFLQRIGLYNVYRSAFREKYCVGISTAGGVGAKKVARYLARFADGLFKDGKRVGTLGFLTEKQDFEKTLTKVEILSHKLVNAISRKKKYPFQNIGSKILRLSVIKPVMLKNLKKNKNTTMKGVYNYLEINGVVNI